MLLNALSCGFILFVTCCEMLKHAAKYFDTAAAAVHPSRVCFENFITRPFFVLHQIDMTSNLAGKYLLFLDVVMLGACSVGEWLLVSSLPNTSLPNTSQFRFG